MTDQNQTVADSDEYQKLLKLKNLILDKYIVLNNELGRKKKIIENLELWIKQLESTNQYSKTNQ